MILAIPLSQGDLSGSQVGRLTRRPEHRQNPRLAHPRRTFGLRSGSMDRFWSKPHRGVCSTPLKGLGSEFSCDMKLYNNFSGRFLVCLRHPSAPTLGPCTMALRTTLYPSLKFIRRPAALHSPPPPLSHPPPSQTPSVCLPLSTLDNHTAACPPPAPSRLPSQ